MLCNKSEARSLDTAWARVTQNIFNPWFFILAFISRTFVLFIFPHVLFFSQVYLSLHLDPYRWKVSFNRPPPSSKNVHFQNEARYTTLLVKMSFICMRMKNDFQIKGWEPTLVLRQRPGGTRKWPIE